MNKIFILGRLGKAVELKYTPTGTAVASFSVATSESHVKNNEKISKTEWHNIIVWGKIGEICSRYLNKGSLVFIEGSIQARSWDDNGVKKYKTEIIANEVKFLDSKEQKDTTEHTKESDEVPNWAPNEIPF